MTKLELTEAQILELRTLANAERPLTRTELKKMGCPGPKSQSASLCYLGLARIWDLPSVPGTVLQITRKGLFWLNNYNAKT